MVRTTNRTRSTWLKSLWAAVLLLGAICHPASAQAQVLFVGNEGDNTLHRYYVDGTDLGQVASGLNSTVGVDTGPDGNIYVACSNDNVIRRFSPNGTDLGVFASGGLAHPTGMAWDDAGNLLVMNYSSPGYIRKFSALGTDLGVFAYTSPSYDQGKRI